MFGGERFDGAKLNDVWVLVNATGVTGVPTWVQLAPAGGPPQARHAATTVYDPTANRLIVYGGCVANCGAILSDVWVLIHANGLDGAPEWIQLPSGTASVVAGAAYDPISNRMMVFGGLSAAGPFSDSNTVHVLVDANGVGDPHWIDLTPSGILPPPRSQLENVSLRPDHQSPHRLRRLSLGGQYRVQRRLGADECQRSWRYTGMAAANPQGAPPSVRQTLPISYDPNSNRLIIFGGLNEYSERVTYDDSWVLTNANGLGGTSEWIKLKPTGPLPTGRRDYASGYDARTNRLVVAFGENDVSEQVVHLLHLARY